MRVNAAESLRHAVDDLNFDSEAFSPVSLVEQLKVSHNIMLPTLHNSVRGIYLTHTHTHTLTLCVHCCLLSSTDSSSQTQWLGCSTSLAP